jgi:trk system potassium uptake protein TrkA
MMKIIIMGCGRVGAQLASLLEQDGHEITVIDTDAYSFRRLPPDFNGAALLGNGMDEDTLERAGIRKADVFVAMTQGDNRNVMAAQIAKHIFNVSRVISRIYDPLRQELYDTLGIEAFSPTSIFAELVREKIES